jgi:hypothetical protein
MKEKSITLKMKDGTKIPGKIIVPETFDEMETLLSKKEIFRLAIPGYIAQAKRKLTCKPRARWLKLKLNELDQDAIAGLHVLGLLKGD